MLFLTTTTSTGVLSTFMVAFTSSVIESITEMEFDPLLATYTSCLSGLADTPSGALPTLTLFI